MNSQFFLNRILKKQQRKAEKEIAVEALIKHMMESSNASRQDCVRAIEQSRFQSFLLNYLAIASGGCLLGGYGFRYAWRFVLSTWLVLFSLFIIGMLINYFGVTGASRISPPPPRKKPEPPPHPPSISAKPEQDHWTWENQEALEKHLMVENLKSEIEEFKRLKKRGDESKGATG